MLEHPRQFLDGHMKQHRVGENPVKTLGRQVEFQEVLLPHLTAAVLARHPGKRF
ncbi:hypothetical protein D3C71_2247230 [compost metagenome]